ncbi:MAG: 5-oxoprolinase subunit PxpA [Thermodesulfobacteriota bacterium]
MNVKRVDLNSDVGEGFGAYKLGLDEQVLPLISSANVACGFHGGDPSLMRRTVALARQHGVAVGAHPGFPDLMGLGRRRLEASPGEVEDYVTYQIGALHAFTKEEGLRLQHVKLHGALYNMASEDINLWEAVARAVARFDPSLVLFTLAGSRQKEMENISARLGLKIAVEFFADRAYNPDGSLVSRRLPGAVIHDHESAAERVVRMVTENKVICRDGKELEVKAQTICVHDDNPAAVSLTQRIRQALQSVGVQIAPVSSFL